MPMPSSPPPSMRPPELPLRRRLPRSWELGALRARARRGEVRFFLAVRHGPPMKWSRRCGCRAGRVGGSWLRLAPWSLCGVMGMEAVRAGCEQVGDEGRGWRRRVCSRGRGGAWLGDSRACWWEGGGRVIFVGGDEEGALWRDKPRRWRCLLSWSLAIFEAFWMGVLDWRVRCRIGLNGRHEKAMNHG